LVLFGEWEWDVVEKSFISLERLEFFMWVDLSRDRNANSMSCGFASAGSSQYQNAQMAANI
jgi:hypothetical protein